MEGEEEILRFPRMRGDEPVYTYRIQRGSLFSPHARG